MRLLGADPGLYQVQQLMVQERQQARNALLATLESEEQRTAFAMYERKTTAWFSSWSNWNSSATRRLRNVAVVAALLVGGGAGYYIGKRK